jgi:hypothetical protein
VLPLDLRIEVRCDLGQDSANDFISSFKFFECEVFGGSERVVFLAANANSKKWLVSKAVGEIGSGLN